MERKEQGKHGRILFKITVPLRKQDAVKSSSEAKHRAFRLKHKGSSSLVRMEMCNPILLI